MIDIKEAVAAAKQFARDTLGVDNLLLEEISSTDGSIGLPGTFSVTLSFPKRAQAETFNRLDAYRQREFKKFEINKSNGEVRGMQILQL